LLLPPHKNGEGIFLGKTYLLPTAGKSAFAGELLRRAGSTSELKLLPQIKSGHYLIFFLCLIAFLLFLYLCLFIFLSFLFLPQGIKITSFHFISITIYFHFISITIYYHSIAIFQKFFPSNK